MLKRAAEEEKSVPLRKKEDRVTFSWLGRGRRGAKKGLGGESGRGKKQ